MPPIPFRFTSMQSVLCYCNKLSKDKSTVLYEYGTVLYKYLYYNKCCTRTNHRINQSINNVDVYTVTYDTCRLVKLFTKIAR